MTNAEFQALLDKYLNGSASAGETKLLDQFFDSYRTNPGEATEISDEIKAEILRNIHRKGHQERSIHFWPLLRIAAAISLLLVLSYFIINHAGSEAETKPAVVAKIEEVSTSKGQKLDIELIDGTRIRLNANSKITYPETFTESIREVTLEGEAYFDVARDATRPFIVRTQFANTQVLGTSFNIHTSAEAVAVTLVEGKVNVSEPNGPSALLSPNQQAVVSPGAQKIAMHDVDDEKYIGWKNNTLHFDHVTLGEAFAVLENWYNVQIKVNNAALANCVITSKYENESLDNVLNSFVFMLKIDYKINGRLVTVSGPGCAKP